MGSTMAEKMLARHAGKARVEAGETIDVQVDIVMANDITAPLAIKEFNKIGIERVFDPQKVIFVSSHFTPAKDIQSAQQANIMRRFAREQGTVYFEIGRGGIEHVVLPEQGLVVPGQVVVGGDSHTCTYGALGCYATGVGSTDVAAALATGEIWMRVPQTIKFVYHGARPAWVSAKDMILQTIGRIGVEGGRGAVMEFTGEAISGLSMEGRLTMANMAIEAGADAGLFPVDEKTLAYVKERAKWPYEVVNSDPDANYIQVYEFDVSGMEPMVACPYEPDNVKPVSQVDKQPLDQVFIGSCTNNRIEDLRIVAGLLRGHTIHPDIRCIIIPGSVDVQRQALREGLLEVFQEAEAVIAPPGCGPCLGGYMGVLGPGERAVSTSNRNFRGRMGHRDAEVYLASPAVAAASAILGRVASPAEIVRKEVAAR
ncbi:MAG TPA: 3-isopropylmalate dehydratase large subunit [Ktedonobacterales bacterium]|nr:3-isopropylmalate dehydratase large subunit [Ktedonobacterales bacterium]